jgi:hypothetical protein
VVDRSRLDELRRRHRPELYPSYQELVDGLTSSSRQRFDAALDAAAAAGAEGEQALLTALTRVPATRRLDVVRAIGAASAKLPDSEAVLERLTRDASGPGSLDLRAVAMHALVARREAAATPMLLSILRDDRSGEMKDAALRYLAAVGDATAVPEATQRLRRLLRHPTREVEGRISALAHLGQHLDPGTEEMRAVVRMVREHWSAVHPHVERPWVARFWPELAPGGPPAEGARLPDPGALRRWAKSSMLLPGGSRE